MPFQSKQELKMIERRNQRLKDQKWAEGHESGEELDDGRNKKLKDYPTE